MGICSSSHLMSKNGRCLSWPSTAKIIHLDGKLQEFLHPIQAGLILSQNPNCFLCSSESMFINSHAPQVPDKEELQLGQIYFLMPLSKSRSPLSLQDLCILAVKASAAIAHPNTAHLAIKTGRAAFPSAAQGYCNMPSGLGINCQPAETAAAGLSSEMEAVIKGELMQEAKHEHKSCQSLGNLQEFYLMVFNFVYKIQ